MIDMAKNDNGVFLRAGQLTKGRKSPVGSLAEVRKNAGQGEGFVNFPVSRQRASNRKAGIDAYKQRVRGFWGKG
jgi:hypothetical protein